MTRFQGTNRRALIFLGGCAVAAGVVLLTSQSASAAAAVSKCQAGAAPKVDWSGCTIFKPKGSFSDANLTGANFKGTTFKGGYGMATSFDNANFSGADFTNAKLGSGIDTGILSFSIANFTGANLTGMAATYGTHEQIPIGDPNWLSAEDATGNAMVDFSAADFTNANLTNANFQ